MRILHIVHQYLPEFIGGTELYTQTLARYQADAQGHRVAVFYPSVEPVPATGILGMRDDNGVRVYAARVGPRTRAGVFRATFGDRALHGALRATLRREEPDIVHVQHLMGVPATTMRHPPELGARLVITIHDYWFPCANAQLVTNYDNTVCAGPAWWINCGRCALVRGGVGDRRWLAPAIAPLLAYRSHLLRGVLANADRVVAPTRFVRDTYRDLGMPTDHFVVVPHGIEIPDYVSASRPEEKKQPPGQLHIVYVGSLARQKGIHVLVKAVNGLPHDGVRLSLCGDLDKFPDYIAHLRKLANHPGIEFRGRVGRQQLWQLLLEEADVAVLPTQWYEVSPLTIDEMFAARVPLVASAIGAIPEKVRDGQDGRLFPAGDILALRQILLQLYQEPEQLNVWRRQMRAPRHMRDHVRDVDNIYRALLAG